MDGTRMLLVVIIACCIVGSIYLFSRLIMGLINSHEKRLEELINNHGKYAESYTKAAVAEAMMQVRKDVECDQDECAGRMQARVDSMVEKRLGGIIDALNKRMEDMERSIDMLRHEVSILASQLTIRHRQ